MSWAPAEVLEEDFTPPEALDSAEDFVPPEALEPALPAAVPSPVPQPDEAIDFLRDAERNGQAADDQGIKEGIFPQGSTPWKTLDGRLYIDPARYNMAVEQMWNLGVIDSTNYTELLKGTVDQYAEATDSYIPSVEKATAARRDLERRAGAFPEAKAAASGLLKGAIQTGGAIVAGPAAAAATIPTGPGAVAVGIAAGAGTAIGLGAAYDKALEASAKESELLDSIYAANQLAPGYNSAGQLVSILAPTPVSVSRLANAANLIRAEKGGAEAAKFISGALGVGASIGVGTDVAIQAANIGLDKLIHPEINPLIAAEQYRQTGQQPQQRPEFDPASTAISGTLGALTAGIGVKARNRVYFADELPMVEQKVKLGTATREEAADYFSMRRTVEILREDQRLIDAGAIAKSTVDFMGKRVLDTNTVINPRFQRDILTQAGFEPPVPTAPRPSQPAIPYAAENPQAAIPLQGQPAAYTGQAFLNRGGAAPAFQGGSNALPGPEGIQALPGPAAVNPQVNPPVVSNDTFDPSTAVEITSAASLMRGDKFTDEAGQEFEVWKNRQGTIEAHPIIDGAAVVNNASGVRFSVTAEAAARNPNDKILTPAASAPVASATIAPEATGSPEVISGEGASISSVEGMRPVYFPVSQLKLSKDVPNFKEDADPNTGVVRGNELQGKVDARNLAPIQAWRRLNGDVEVISGRHRFDLFRRNNEPVIPAQIYNEADGFTKQDALTLDAELNIRDENGTTKDYSNYFRNAALSYDQATERSLLSRAKGRAGFSIGAMGSDDLYALHQSGKISDAKAEAIALAAPRDVELQRIGITYAKEFSPEALTQLIRTSQRAKSPTAKQGDLFGNSDDNLNKAVALVKASQARIQLIDNQILSVKGAVKRPEAAREMGVDVKNPEAILAKIAELQQAREKYVNFLDDPATLAEVRVLAFGEEQVPLFTQTQDPFNLTSEPPPPATPASAEDAEAARRAAAIKDGYDSTPSMFDAGPSRPRSKSMADAGPQTPVMPAAATIPKPALNTYNDAQVFADYPDAVGVVRAMNGTWTMPLILGGLDKVPVVEMPEAVEFVKALSGGSPKVQIPRKRNALGSFSPNGQGVITLHPDLIKAGGEASAMMTFMHEIGHNIQFMDDFRMEKGNLLGIISGKPTLKQGIPLDPNPAPVEGWAYSQQPITSKQREAIRTKAEADLRASLEGEVRKVIVNEPIYAQSGVTPEIVKGLFGLDAREQWPELYDWFARQDGATKANIVKQAMKGILDARLAKFQVQGEQIGTNTREETQTVGGREPTQDELREAFHAAMRSEMNARNVADLKYIRQELIDLTKWWKPFDIARADPTHLAYRFSPEELFADAMSVLLNSPADLKTRAPIFYDTFWNNLDARPQVKAKLVDIYDRISKGRDAVLDKRQARDWENYGKGDQAFLDAFNKATSRRETLTGLWENLKDQYYDEFYPLTSAIEQGRKEGKLPAAEKDPYRYLTEEHPMADGRLQLRMIDMQRVLMGLDKVGLPHYKLDDYLRYTRIAFEKYEVTKEVDGQMVTLGYELSPTNFNPEGETQRTAQDRLDYMQRNMSPEQWAVLQQSAKDFRDQFQDVVKFYWEEGMLSDELWEKFSTNDNYATFTVMEYVKGYTSSRMVARQGTVKPIYRPTVEMPKKMVSMFRAAQRNKFKRVMVPQLTRANPDIAKPAPMKFNGKFMEPQKPTEEGYELVTWREKGQTVGAHVRTRWAEAVNHHSPAMGDVILKSLNWGFRESVYKLIIQYNPNFQLFTGPVKDFGRALVNQPGGIKGRLSLIKNITKDVLALSQSRDGRRVLLEFTGTSLAGIVGATGGAALGSAAGPAGMALGGVVAGNAATYAGFFAGRMFAAAIETLPWLPDDPSASVDWARGDIGRNALMREMIENYAIGGPWAYLGRGTATSNPDKAIDALMAKFNVGGEAKSLPWIYRQVANYFNDVEFAGQILQNIPKTSSYTVNTRTLKMPKDKAAYWVRNHIGLPNTAKKGKHIGNFQALAPFANIFVRSFESMAKLFGGKEAATMSRKEYILAYFLLGFGALQILQRMAKEGMLGEDLEKAYAGASEYDITNKVVVPLGVVNSPTGSKSALMTLPVDDNHRWIGAIFSKTTKAMCRMAQGRPLDIGGLDILTGMTASLPGQNPVIEIGDKWVQFFTNKDPVDHRNQPILSEDERKVGGLYAFKPMLGWTLKESGVANFFKYDPRASTFTEAAVGSVPAFNRFLKITDTGTREDQRQAEDIEGIVKARYRLNMPPQVTALRQEYFWLRTRGEARTMRENDRYSDLQVFENLFQRKLEEADTEETLGNHSSAQNAIREIIRESNAAPYKQR
jgi:hypothetical protein